MILNNLKLAPGNLPINIKTNGTKIIEVSSTEIRDESDKLRLSFDDAIVFPGLINSHDHLDFNLFPMLGNKIYNNYTEWGTSIHIEYKNEITNVLKIPKHLRVEWGIYKNLLCGITTVVNHGMHLDIEDPLINVIQPDQNLHSVRFEKLWKLKLNNPFKKNKPCVIHAGEGTDKAAEYEIDELLKFNFLKRKLIAIHGVAMNETQAKKIKALVWCPASNFFLLNRTAAINKLKRAVNILFGTDSTLTSNWNIWEHIRMAKVTNLVNNSELFEMLTANPAKTWKLDCGSITEGKIADIVIAIGDNFYAVNPEDILMIIQNGNIVLFDKSIQSKLKKAGFSMAKFSSININGKLKYVKGDLPRLIKEIKKYTSCNYENSFYRV